MPCTIFELYFIAKLIKQMHGIDELTSAQRIDNNNKRHLTNIYKYISWSATSQFGMAQNQLHEVCCPKLSLVGCVVWRAVRASICKIFHVQFCANEVRYELETNPKFVCLVFCWLHRQHSNISYINDDALQAARVFAHHLVCLSFRHRLEHSNKSVWMTRKNCFAIYD